MPLESRVINAFYDLLAVIDCEYTKFTENMTVKKWGEVFKTLTIQGSEWMNKKSRVVNRIELIPIAKVWVKFLKSRLMPTTHTTTISQDRLILLYAIVKGLAIDVGKIIKKEIREFTTRKQKSVVFLFPSLIIGICKAFGVKFEASDERVKNEGAIIARTVERIVVESTAVATTVHPTVAKGEQATGFKTMMQELSESINTCVQVQKEENQWF